jgi:replicative DNA helicase
MNTVFKSLFDKEDVTYLEYLGIFRTEEGEKLLSLQEEVYIEYLTESYMNSNIFPSENIFLDNFPELSFFLQKGKDYDVKDFRIHINNLYSKRFKLKISSKVTYLTSDVSEKGLTEEHIEKLNKLVNLSDSDISEDDIQIGLGNYIEEYEERKNQPIGLQTNVKEVDKLIGGMSLGTVSVIMAYVSQYKSTWGINIAYHNTTKLKYNVAIISLEVPKQDIKYNLLCRHSSEPEFSEYTYIAHDKIRYCEMDDKEEKYLHNTVLPDFESKEGKIVILDETDFKSMSFTEIRNTLEKVDDKLRKETGHPLDAVIWDHAHLLKYTEGSNVPSNDGIIINMYMSFIRKLSIKFRKIDGEYTQLANIVLAQTNRKGFENADKNKGKYNLLALSEAHELERAAYRVMSIWTSEHLKSCKEATVQLLKNRSGRNEYEPITVYADGASYVFGEEIEEFDTMEDIDSWGDDDF